MSVIRVKRCLDALEDLVPSTLVVKKAKKVDGVDVADSMVFKFHHSTGNSHIEDDPKLMIPRVMATKASTKSATAHSVLQQRQQPRFKVLSHNRMRTANGSELKVMDLAKDLSSEEEQIPAAVRAMMQEYSQQNAMEISDETTNYVYDVYFLDEKAQSESLIFDSNGAIAIELEEEEALYFDDDNDNDDRFEDDEDSNAEDDYRNDYPDSEEDQEDHYMQDDW